jgi:hypothetical protein
MPSRVSPDGACWTRPGLDATRLPVVIRYDGQVIIDPSLPDLARTIGVSIKHDTDTCEVPSSAGDRRA